MKIISSMMILILASVACMQSVEAIAPVAPTPIAETQTVEPTSQVEQIAGEVYEIPTSAPLCAKVTAIESLHLRERPNEKAKVLGYLKNGEEVRVLSFGAWWKISTSQGEGYSNSKYLSLTECTEE